MQGKSATSNYHPNTYQTNNLADEEIRMDGTGVIQLVKTGWITPKLEYIDLPFTDSQSTLTNKPHYSYRYKTGL